MLRYSNYLKYLKNYLLLVLPKFINKISIDKNQLFIYTSPHYIRELCLFLRDNTNCLFKVLVDIIGVDYLGRTKRFEVCYTLLSLTFNSRVIIKVNVDELNHVPSITCLFRNANWFEREVWDLYGIMFIYHPDLRRILTDYGFKGFPLRKDFPLSGYSEMVYDVVTEHVQYKPIKLIQEFRAFNYKTPWGYKLSDNLVSVNKVKYNTYRIILDKSKLLFLTK